MGQTSARFAVIAVTVFALAMALNLGAFAVAFKLPDKRSIGVCSMVDQRIALAKAAPSPKMLLVGGSGTTQGVNAQALSDALGIRAQNFGLQGSFGPGFELFLAQKALRPGDTVLLSLEYSAYVMDKPTDIALDVMAGCGRDYLARYALAERLQIAAGFPLNALLDRATFAAAPETPKDLPAYTAWGDRPPGYYAAPANAQMRRVALYRPIHVIMLPDAAAAREITELLDWAQDNQVSVIATWPNTLEFEEYRTMPGFGQIRRFYEDLGVPVVGEPQIAMLTAEYMNDTQYHLNDAGIHVRTARLAEALAQRPELLASLRSN